MRAYHTDNTSQGATDNPFMNATSSRRQRLGRENHEAAVHYSEGREPTYGRIMGLSQRLDRAVKNKMKLGDAEKTN